VSRSDPLDTLGLSLRSGAVEIVLVRHADAVPESEAIAAYDDYEAHPLSERGRAQAQAAAERCAEGGLAAVYTSPIRRARETAEAIASAARAELFEEPAVREIAIGPGGADGLTLRERLEWLATLAIREGSWGAIPGTEPSAGVRARMLDALRSIAERHRGARVAVVSHAGSINAALGAIAGTAHDFLFPLANASLSVVRVGGGRMLLMSANDTAHLRAQAVRGNG
jgi:broad specificity phosphatase PhoE